jgi:hypothetical protein
MPRQNNGILYTYSWIEKTVQYVVVLFWSIVMLFVTAILIMVLFRSLTLAISGMVVDPFLIGVCLLVLPFVLLFPLIFSNIYPSIRISNGGISVQVFLFWWIFVPWKDVEDIRRIRLSRSRLVIVRRLTPVHRLFGSSLTWRFKPAFIIKRTLKGYNEAVETIEEKIGKNH